MIKLSTKKLLWLSKLTLPVIAVALIAGACASEKYLSGPDAYEKFCASCPGVTGKGDGPIAIDLKPTPHDLTLLAKWNQGVFPYHEVYEIIDGRAEVRTHGTGQMPVWGEQFAVDSPYSHEVVRELALYLAGIQAKG